MLHGFARNAAFWNRWVPAIADTRRVYRPDLLGCGHSDLPPEGYRYTPEGITRSILAVLDALSLARVHWVGESSGGLVGLLLAANHPERIASLVLCNTPTRISDEIRKIYAARPPRAVPRHRPRRQPDRARALRPHRPRLLAGGRGLIC
jgi:pimeloyl-ACP methyl ester carboxylesterase